MTINLTPPPDHWTGTTPFSFTKHPSPRPVNSNPFRGVTVACLLASPFYVALIALVVWAWSM